MKYMTNVLTVVNGLFATAVRSLYPSYANLRAIVQGSATSGKFGDYKCVAAMSIAQVSPDLDYNTVQYIMTVRDGITLFELLNYCKQ